MMFRENCDTQNLLRICRANKCNVCHIEMRMQKLRVGNRDRVDIYESWRSVSELSGNICSTYVSSGFKENRFSSIKLYNLIQDRFNIL